MATRPALFPDIAAESDACRDRQEHPESGFALVAVLGFLLVVAAVAVPFALAARTQALVQANLYRIDRLDLLAGGLADVLSSRVSGADGAQGEVPSLNGARAACNAGGVIVTARAQEHGGLIDLNAAEPALLAFGFAALGLDAATSRQLADAAISYRSPAGQPDASQQSEVEIRGGLKHARFESVLELSDFAPLGDMPPDVIAGVFTVHSRQGTIARPWMPEALARRMAGTPSQVTQFVTNDRVRSSAVTVEVSVREAGAELVGHAGFVVAGTSRVEALPRPLAPPADPAVVDCRGLFGAEVARSIEEWL